MLLTVYLVFILSGCAGLIYESIWARYLGLIVGHSAYAQILVLAIFLGGMALGAIAVGSRSETLRDPLRWYAAVELTAGIIGLLFHDAYLFVTSLAYDSIFPALQGTAFLTIVKWSIAGALILPQSILLGTTFPLMGAGVLRRVGGRPGLILAFLYFANSLGAAVGVLFAGFYLLSTAGLEGTLLVASMLNMVVGLVSLVVARLSPAKAAREADLERTPEVEPAAARVYVGTLNRHRLVQLLLGVSFGTAVASFIYEIGWLRMLALVLGSATHSFELMLSAFILGLALGSFWVRTRADRWGDPLRALGIVQWVMGFAALATLPLYTASFGWTADLIQTFAKSDAGYTGITLARYGICLAVMLPSTFCAGITLPLIMRTLIASGVGERAIGSVYGINTLGSILGAGLAGLVLMPWIGVRSLLMAGASLDMALGVLILIAAAGRRGTARRFAYGAAGALVMTVAVTAGAVDFKRQVLMSGVFRYGRLPDPDDIEVLYYKDGRTATVSVQRTVSTGEIAIKTNGKADGSLESSWFEACTDSTLRKPLSGDGSTQTLLPLITLAHAPHARNAAVIGQGTGMSSHLLLGSPEIERLTTIEIEPEMIRGSREYYPANRRVFDDPRSVIVIDDAKTHFASSRERYDLIMSEPSNPWVSGVASLFTTEFYSHVRRYLSAGGVFGQWLHLYEIDDGLVLSVLAGMYENFDSYELFLTAGRDMIVVATNSPEMPKPDWSIFALPAITQDLCHFVPLTPEALEATRIAHREALAPLLYDWGQPNSDFFPVLDLLAERTRYLGRGADGFVGLPAQRFDITAPFSDRRSPPGTELSVPLLGIARVHDRAVGAGLRALRAVRVIDSTAQPAALKPAVYRRNQWEAVLAADSAPNDWRLWLQNFRIVERDLHAGTAGFADETFYRSAYRFIDRHDAPAPVRNVVAFLHGLSSWDFERASRAADMLLQDAVDNQDWIPPDELLDGAVVAKLRSGDGQGAKAFHDALSPRRRRSPGDLRTRLLKAYLDTVGR